MGLRSRSRQRKARKRERPALAWEQCPCSAKCLQSCGIRLRKKFVIVGELDKVRRARLQDEKHLKINQRDIGRNFWSNFRCRQAGYGILISHTNSRRSPKLTTLTFGAKKLNPQIILRCKPCLDILSRLGAATGSRTDRIAMAIAASYHAR